MEPTGSEAPQIAPSEPSPTYLPPALVAEQPLLQQPVPTPRDPVWSGWDVLLIAGLAILTLLVAEIITAIVAMVFFYRHTAFRDLIQTPVVSLVGQAVGYVVVALFMVMLVEGKYRNPFLQAIRWNWNPRSVPKFLGIGVLTVILDMLGRYLPMPKSTPFEQFFSKPTDAYLIAIFAVTLGPLMEELFFRGFLYPVLARRTGVVLAVVLTSIPFGLLHYVQYQSWGAVLVITMVGVVLTVVRVISKSVAASFVVHVGYNATLMVLTAVATDGFQHMEKMTTLLVR